MNRFQAIDPALLELTAGDRLLDVGCGVGRHVLEMSHLPGQHVGLDWGREDLRRAAYWFHLMRSEGKARGWAHFVEGDATRLPFPDEYFDRVICSEVLEHVSDDRLVLAELVRVLRPGGVLAISVPDEYTERLLWRYAPEYRSAPGGHVRIYQRKEIARLLQASGARPFAIRFRHSLEAVRWLTEMLVDGQRGSFARRRNGPGPMAQAVRWLLDTPSHQNSPVVTWFDSLGNYLLPKSIVVYGRKRGYEQQ